MDSVMGSSFQITLYEIFAFLGLIQSVFILVYIASRAWRSSSSIIPFVYFLLMVGIFTGELASGSIFQNLESGDFILRVLWLSIPFFSYLLVLQVVNLESLPRIYNGLVLFVLGGCFLFSMAASNFTGECTTGLWVCEFFQQSVILSLIIASLAVLAFLILSDNGFQDVREDEVKRDRYWLSITLILINVIVVSLSFLNYIELVTSEEVRFVRLILGMTFVYLATTSLFRLYPPPLPIQKKGSESLSKAEMKIAEKIDNVMRLDKLYQEPSFTRADLARELEISEGVITKVTNAYYGKSFPVLINEKRIDEAKYLLLETDENIKSIAVEVGFNSIASFNRVFKEYVGATATEFRKENKVKIG